MECRKHNHGSNRGVCASCLREKLSKLPNTTSYYIIHRSDFSCASTVSSPSPSSFPPIKDQQHHRRGGSMSMAFGMSGNLIEGLKKSRSMAHVPRDSYVGNDTNTKKLKSATVKKKTGFWSRLLNLKGRGGGGGGGCGGDGDGEFVSSRQRVY